MSDTRQQLAKAFDLIRQDQLDAAMTLLRPITEAQPENADAWWLLANASSEPRDARRALVNVLKLNPSYPKARALLDKLNELYPPRDDELMMMMEIEDIDAPLPGDEESDGFDDSNIKIDSGIDDLFEEEKVVAKAARPADDFGTDDDPFAELLEQDGGSGAGGSSSVLRIILLALVLCVVLAIAAVLLLGGGDDDDEPVADGGDTPSAVDGMGQVAAADINPDNATLLEDVRVALQNDAQAQIGEGAEAVFVRDAAGVNAVIETCAQPGPGVRNVVLDAMSLLASRVGNTSAIHGDLAGVQVRVVDCDRPDDLLFGATAPLSAAIDFALDGSEAALNRYRTSWQTAN